MGALSQSAIAQTPQCKSISESAARLACYDKSGPPAASSAAAKPATPSAAAKSRAPASNVDNAKYVDTISAEDAIMMPLKKTFEAVRVCGREFAKGPTLGSLRNRGHRWISSFERFYGGQHSFLLKILSAHKTILGGDY